MSLVALIAVTFVAPVSLDAQVPAPRSMADLRRSLVEKLNADSIPSLALAVARDGQIVWEEAFGIRDLERRAPALTTTPYPIASVSKPLTATALMVLVQEGRLALDPRTRSRCEA
jgi:CubicO group peptidase (beta-lactamase class C family)